MIPQSMAEAETYIRSRYPQAVSAVVILGSGLGDFADKLDNRTVIPYQCIPHFPESTVEGHSGNLVLSEYRPGFHIACMQGRFHFYEGYTMSEVVFPLRVLHLLGAKTLVVTNAAGGINPGFKPGDLMLIADHLNLTGSNPLLGKNPDFLGPRFPDMSEAYSSRLRQLAQQAAEQQGLALVDGVYAGLSGPTYETPAEVRMLRTLGADAAGMSTVAEVIAANHMGMEVLGLSCITNPAAGLSPVKLSHQEVMETAERVKPKFMALLGEILSGCAERG